MMKGIPKVILRRLFKKEITLTRYTYTENTDAWGQKVSTSVAYTIMGEIQEVTSEDSQLWKVGEVQMGDAWGYFYPSYDVGKEITLDVQKDDEVTWNSKTWIVTEIQSMYYGRKESYKKVYLKRKMP
jgi:hypothetical protein